MDLNDKELRLKQILEKNIREGKVGTAIAITGSWGVGKTFFWNNFLEKGISNERINHLEKILNRKYAYISLFGIESLSDLKTQIYSNIENYHSSIEVPKWLKGLPSIFKDTRISGLGISAPAKLIDNLMFNQVRDAIICFDDFERMSNKLDIKDVMGLANQLKLERNCQIILILDESKTEDNNKEKYAEYKEKLIDETIKIISVEPLIRANTKDVDKKLVNLMVRFADELEIHNFRFFQKVINLYKQFRAQLPDEVAYSTKEIILIKVLQGYLIEDYGKDKGIKWDDLSLNSSLIRRQLKQNDKIDSIFEKLEKISYKLTLCEDNWSLEFKKWFEQRDQVDFEVLKKLAKSDLNSEKNNLLKDSLQDLMNKWRNLEVDENYCEELFTVVSKLVGIESLGLLEFSTILLKKFGKPELSRRLKKSIINFLKMDLEKNTLDVYEKYLRFSVERETIFHRYIKLWRFHNPLKGLPSLLDVIKAELIHGTQLRYAEEAIKNTEEKDWEKFIFEDALADSELRYLTRAGLVDQILRNSNLRVASSSLLKTKIINILQTKMNESDSFATKENYKYVIENFKKEGLL